MRWLKSSEKLTMSTRAGGGSGLEEFIAAAAAAQEEDRKTRKLEEDESKLWGKETLPEVEEASKKWSITNLLRKRCKVYDDDDDNDDDDMTMITTCVTLTMLLFDVRPLAKIQSKYVSKWICVRATVLTA